MSFFVLLLLMVCVAAYWIMTQILPERRQISLLRPSLADGFLTQINELRHAAGLPILEVDDGLMDVAERKASHQLMTGVSEEGWDYPDSYRSMFGQSLLMEALLEGSVASMGERLARQRDIFDGEWIQCGIGVAGGASGQIVVAMVFCRETWEPAAAFIPQLSRLERLVLGR